MTSWKCLSNRRIMYRDPKEAGTEFICNTLMSELQLEPMGKGSELKELSQKGGRSKNMEGHVKTPEISYNA